MSFLTVHAARATTIVIAAAGVLALAALPSAAHAADVETCSQQVTSETAPWLSFSQSENFYEILGAAENEFVATTSTLSLDFPEQFTADDLAVYQAALEAADTARLEAQQQVGTENPLQDLADQLDAADPDNTTGWQENLEALFTSFFTGTDTTEYEAAFTAFTQAQQDFVDEAEAILQADEPAGGPYESPVLPDDFETNVGGVLTGVEGIVARFQTVVLDGAAQFVAYEEVCITTTVADTAPAAAAPASARTLAATGSSDAIALGTAAGLLLLAGAAVTVVSMRRRSA